MSDPTPPAVSEALREAVEYAIARYAFVGCGKDEEGEEFHWVDGVKTAARAILAGPIASEIARLTGERDAAIEARDRHIADVAVAADGLPEAVQALASRAEAAEAETARLRAEVADAFAQGRREERSRCVHIARMHFIHANEPSELVASSIAACIRDPDYVLRELQTQQPLATAPAETQKPETGESVR